MPVKYVTGDLFDLNLPAIGHGVNMHGVMGSGIAPIFKQKWPKMYIEYKAACRDGELELGGIYPYETDSVTVINMATQFNPGPNATLAALRSALKAAILYCEEHDITEFGIPRIGAGIGGLKWETVKSSIEEIANETTVTIVVVSLPGADG